MIINSVELQNYRIHTSLLVQFERGINLLIGQNGTGKSSILEALGFALFDSELRSKGSDRAIKFGSKSAVITVRFTANDGNEYRVERRIGISPRWHLFFGDEKAPRYDRKDQILSLMRTLSGIHQNENLIFTTVICAVQNRFVDMFNLTGQPRADLFDKLFDTDIYRKLNTSFASGDDSINSLYKEQKDRIEGQISSLEELSVDESSVVSQLQYQKDELTLQINNLAEKVILGKSVEQKLSVVNDSVRHCSTLEQELLYLEKELINYSGSLEQTKLKIVEAEISTKIIVDNSHSFAKYQELMVERSKLESLLSEESQIRLKYDECTNSIRLRAITIEKSLGEIQTILARIEITSEQLHQTEAEINELQLKYSEKESHLQIVKETGLLCKKNVESYERSFSSMKTSEDSLQFIQNRIVELVKVCDSKPGWEGSLNSLSQELFILEGHEKHIRQLDDHIRHTDIALSTLIDAEKSIGCGMCPILNENCQNVISTNGAVEYFSNRKNQFHLELNRLNEERKSLDGILDQISVNHIKTAEFRVKVQSAVDGENQIQTLQSNADLEQQRIEHQLDVMKIIEPNVPVESDLKSHFLNRFEYHKNEITRLRQVYSDTENAKNQLQKKCFELVEKRQLLSSTIAELIVNKDSMNAQIPVLTSQQESAMNLKIALAAQLDQFQKTHTEIAQISVSMSENEVGYRLVLENRELANRLEELRINEQHITTLKNDTLLRQVAINEEIALFSKEILENEQKIFAAELHAIRTSETEINQQVILLSERVRQNEELLKKVAVQKERMTFLKKELSVLVRKQELTELFRKNVNDMGRFVVSGIVETIAAEATEHFRSFTGRTEKIIWNVDEQDKYTVYLVLSEQENQFRREYSVLSGGEQVAVALSLRSALARELSSADFAIFDEPTVNLDSERKMALAESLKSMVGTLGQTIIVTHDDLFREMAQKVIEL